jgi:signal transduction histidine kinase
VPAEVHEETKSHGDPRQPELESFKLPPDAGAVRAMVEDCYSNVWVGTARGTLLRVTGGTLFDETERLSLRRMSIRALHATADGSVWIGYAGWGLGRLKDGRLSRATIEQGLYDNYVSQIIDDGAGWLWCAGDHGIFKVRQQTIEDVFAGLQPSAQSIHYGGEEGLHNLQAAFGFSPGAARTRDGRLWMPMRTGLAVIDPAKLPGAALPPAVVLERVKVDGRTIAWYGGILPPPPGTQRNVLDLHARGAKVRLGPAHRRLEFEFTGLSLAAPDNIHFRYRLKNYDEDWTETMARSASYSRLPDGDYRFELSACNADGVWNQTDATLDFKVTPFVWQTWWFRLSALAGFTSAMVGLGRYVSFRRLRARLRGLEQQAALHKERARIARDIHDDLGTRLSEITLLTELASRKPVDLETSGAHARQIASTVRQVTDSLDEIVWAINPRNDSLPHVVSYIGQFALRFLEMAGIACHLDLPDQPPKRAVSAEVRHNLFLVAKEALNNVVRHAQATRVWLTITATEKVVVLTIKDNGRGFAAASGDPNADGLRNMRQRMSDIGGQCNVESQPGAGTEISCSYHLVSDEVRT